MKILVTGAAGFIGSNLVERLLITEPGVEIVNLDSVNDYYDVSIKEYRLRRLQQLADQHPECKYSFVKGSGAGWPPEGGAVRWSRSPRGRRWSAPL